MALTAANFLLLGMGLSGADESLQRIPLSSSQESPNVTGPLQGIYMWSACRSAGDLKNVRYRTAPYRLVPQYTSFRLGLSP